MDCNDPRMAFADPMTRFTCVLSALIHDVGHNGVPNAQLNEEQDKYAVHYGGRSVAEQMAIDVGWRLLMMPQYVHLRAAIFFNEEEMQRFRYILITAVLATDIADADLRQARQERWQRAFGDEASIHSSLSSPYMSPTALQSLQALLSIETLLQVSDLAHTMQHWEVYRKFNERFYCECIVAYEKGRADTDPRKDWHKGETGFFDHCVIPLAKRLKECGVFGVSSDECLAYAKANRDQWVSTGKEVTREMIKRQQQREDRPGKLDL
jgi:3'5'-cyclic nucleotide phosphodiesterase